MAVPAIENKCVTKKSKDIFPHSGMKNALEKQQL